MDKGKLYNFFSKYKDEDIVPKISKDKGDNFLKELEDKIKNADKFKYIIVGDNPGKDEYKGKNGRQGYFIGKTSYIRNFMNKCAKENEIFYFNKTPFYTKETEKLEEFIKKNKSFKDKFISSQKEMAELLVEIALKSDTEIWIVGHSHFDEKEKLYNNSFPQKKFFKHFQIAFNDLINKNSKLKNRVFVFSHPSHNGFAADIFDTIVKQNGVFSLDKFKELGRERAQEYFDI